MERGGGVPQVKKRPPEGGMKNTSHTWAGSHDLGPIGVARGKIARGKNHSEPKKRTERRTVEKRRKDSCSRPKRKKPREVLSIRPLI